MSCRKIQTLKNANPENALNACLGAWRTKGMRWTFLEIHFSYILKMIPTNMESRSSLTDSLPFIPYSDSSWMLTFCFGCSQGQFYLLLPHVKPCLMPIGLNSNLENIIPGPTVALVLHAPKHAFKALYGLAFFNTAIVTYRLFTSKPLSMLTLFSHKQLINMLNIFWLHLNYTNQRC